MLQKYLIEVAIPHQSQIGFEEPICDSFPPGEAFGAFLNCKINYNLNTFSAVRVKRHVWNRRGVYHHFTFCSQ